MLYIRLIKRIPERDEQLKIRNEKKHPINAEKRLIIRRSGGAKVVGNRDIEEKN